MSMSLEAACACGSFKFKSAGAPIFQLTCHCQQCREASGASFTNLAFFKVAETTVEGETKIHEFVADSGTKTVRETCVGCGQMVLDRTQAFPQIIGVIAERIGPPYAFEPRCHVWLESRVLEPSIPDGVKTFQRGMQ